MGQECSAVRAADLPLKVTKTMASYTVVQPVIMVHFMILISKIGVAVKTDCSVYRFIVFGCVNDLHIYVPFVNANIQ